MIDLMRDFSTVKNSSVHLQLDHHKQKSFFSKSMQNFGFVFFHCIRLLFVVRKPKNQQARESITYSTLMQWDKSARNLNQKFDWVQKRKKEKKVQKREREISNMKKFYRINSLTSKFCSTTISIPSWLKFIS